VKRTRQYMSDETGVKIEELTEFLTSVLTRRAMMTARTVPRLKKTKVWVILARYFVPIDCDAYDPF